MECTVKTKNQFMECTVKTKNYWMKKYRIRFVLVFQASRTLQETTEKSDIIKHLALSWMGTVGE